MTDDKFPFNNQYYELIKGTTLSKRGVWWTAILLVESKATNEEEEDKSKSKDKKIIKKVIIQRWRRFKQGEDGFRWNKSKDFTISSKQQWSKMKEILDEWVEDKSWE